MVVVVCWSWFTFLFFSDWTFIFELMFSRSIGIIWQEMRIEGPCNQLWIFPLSCGFLQLDHCYVNNHVISSVTFFSNCFSSYTSIIAFLNLITYVHFDIKQLFVSIVITDCFSFVYWYWMLCKIRTSPLRIYALPFYTFNFMPVLKSVFLSEALLSVKTTTQCTLLKKAGVTLWHRETWS